MIINFGDIISRKDMNGYLSNGRSIKEFNERLQSQLGGLVYEINANDKEKLRKYFYVKQAPAKKIILFIPAIAGFIVNAPLYFAIHLTIKNHAKDHYDSIMTGLLFFIFPLYVLALTLLIFFLTKNLYAFLLVALLPFMAWSYLQLKKQIKG
jgi:hypothetical protein